MRIHPSQQWSEKKRFALNVTAIIVLFAAGIYLFLGLGGIDTYYEYLYGGFVVLMIIVTFIANKKFYRPQPIKNLKKFSQTDFDKSAETLQRITFGIILATVLLIATFASIMSIVK